MTTIQRKRLQRKLKPWGHLDIRGWIFYVNKDELLGDENLIKILKNKKIAIQLSMFESK